MTKQEYFKYRHKAKYVDWQKESEIITLDKVQYYEKLTQIRKELKRKECVNFSKTKREDWGYDNDNIYDEYVSAKRRRKYRQIYTRQNGKFIIYQTGRKGDGLLNAGRDSFATVRDKFLERTGLGRKGLSAAFGSSPFEWRICTPDPIYFINPIAVSTRNYIDVVNASGIDGCSQYPTALSGRLPTMNGFKEVKGTVKPNKEYPFALYIKSGFVAVEGEFDTHDWLKLEFKNWLFTNHQRMGNQIYYLNNPDEDVTILMKESDYSFKDEMEHFFNIKESYPHESPEYRLSKMVMNAFIGMLHISTESGYGNHPFNHLACIAIARANHKLIEKIKLIGIKNIIHVCVDGIIYKGKTQYGVYERKLGNFEQEFINAQVALRCINNYIVKENGVVTKYKHGSFDIYEDTQELIDDCPPKEFEDLFRWGQLRIDSPYDKNEDYLHGRI